MAIVQGPDYLIVTTMPDALKLAGQAEVREHETWRRMGLGTVPVLDKKLSPEGIEIRGWTDFTLCLTRQGAVSRTASVSGAVWWLAGFVVGDAIRFTRYRNATVVDKSAMDNRHSVLVKERSSARPRHYVGNQLCDITHADKIRAIALRGRLILTTPGTDIGRLCEGIPQRLTLKELLLREAHGLQGIDIADKPRQLVEIEDSVSIPAMFAPGDAHPVTWKTRTVVDRYVNVYGRIWSLAGFAIGDTARVVEYGNALVAEKCDAAEARFRVGSPSHRSPYHVFSLKRTRLSDAPALRVLAFPGRIVLTRENSDLAALCDGLEQMPEDRVGVESLLQQHGLPVGGTRSRNPTTTNKKPAAIAQASRVRRRPQRGTPLANVEVGSYAIPEGKRLQMQGKWLQQFGFAPGLKYRVVPMEAELQLELVGEGGMTVTEHSPGRAKLYVPTETLKPLSCPTVKVLAGEGRIRLVPATA
ncbi:hypothetical protein DIE18_03040 [Burkholderia sp. Bp9125]|nr:hypothetical protein DIE18_03040 [Burkholderia sp. Bp9125]